MADMLRMSFEDMEKLAMQFDNAQTELTDLKGNVESFMSEFDGKFADWSKNAGAKADFANNGILSALTGTAQNVMGSWMGDRHDNFESNTYPCIADAIKGYNDELEKFSTGLSSIKDQYLPTLEQIVKDIQNGADRCGDTARWVREYAQGHRDVENEGYAAAMGVGGNIADNKVGNTNDPHSLIKKAILSLGDDVNHDNFREGTFDEINKLMDEDKDCRLNQGNFTMFDFKTQKNPDGSGNLSFSCSTSHKTTTEVTTYDANGNLVDIKYMEGYRDPSSISGVFSKAGAAVKDVLSGGLTGHGDFRNDPTRVYKPFDLNIPAGGYVRVTDDLSLMYSKDDLIKQTIAENVASDLLPSTDEKSAAGEMIDKTINKAADYMGPAKYGIKGINAVLKANNYAENITIGVQEGHTKGNGATYFHL